MKKLDLTNEAEVSTLILPSLADRKCLGLPLSVLYKDIVLSHLMDEFSSWFLFAKSRKLRIFKNLKG